MKINIANPFGKRKYEHLVKVNIYKKSILNNIDTISKKVPKWKIAPVLKSNAYGHNAEEVVQILEKSKKIDFYCTDSLFEALQVKRNTKKDILILGFTPIDNILNFDFKNIIYSLGSVYELESLAKVLQHKQRVYLKLNTGMNRRGIDFVEVEQVFKILHTNKNIVVHGIFSHFADADGVSEVKTLKQIDTWNKFLKVFRQNIPDIRHYHLSATSGIRYYDKIDASHLRLGIGMYGIDPNNTLQLEPSLEIVSKIAQIRKIEKGDGVGYGFTFKADKPMTIATVPFGYFEGSSRRLSSQGYVKVKGRFCKIVGRVSMNVMSIDITNAGNVKEGDEVIVLSREKTDHNSVQNIAKACETIPYEILVKINGDLKRNII